MIVVEDIQEEADSKEVSFRIRDEHWTEEAEEWRDHEATEDVTLRLGQNDWVYSGVRMVKKEPGALGDWVQCTYEEKDS